MNKVRIISHRGGFLPEGPIPEVQNKYTIPENSLEAFKRAFDNGWGIETDIRLSKGDFVVIHDWAKIHPNFKILTLNELCELTQKYTHGELPFIAFQIKRESNFDSGLAVGRAVAQKIQQYGLKTSILFDATLEEAKVLHHEFPWLNLSVSVGEENYSSTIYTVNQALKKEFRDVYNCIWADEWKKPASIYNKDTFQMLKGTYTRIDVISPELHYSENHPLAKDLNKLISLWQEIISWEIADGICTDYPTYLELLT